MSVTKDEAAYIAKLACLRFEDNELDKITKDLNEILDYMAQLNEVDTTGVEPLSHPVLNEPWMREDTPEPSINRQDALQKAPQADDEYFLVPKVIK